MALASKHVDRPRRASFTTNLSGVIFEPGDYPAIDHAILEDVAEKTSGTGATMDFVTRWYVRFGAGEIEGKNIKPGDWIHVTSAGLVSDDEDGWYRIRGVDDDAGTNSVSLFMTHSPTSDNWSDIVWKVLPAMMIESTTLNPMTCEIDLNLVEIPHYEWR